MNDAIRLARYQTVVERPFTSPDHIDIDKVVLDIMIAEVLKHLLIDPERMNQGYVYYFPSQQQWQKRILLNRLHELACGQSVTVVGFFGKRRLAVSEQVCQELSNFGKILDSQVPQQPAILGYYTWLLSDEINYANLVLLKNEAAIEQWRSSSPHTYVKDTISPRYYECVRIYNGRFTLDRSAKLQRLILLRVKYYDFRQSPTWQAVRSLVPNESVPTW